jgi:hypothetical protein
MAHPNNKGSLFFFLGGEADNFTKLKQTNKQTKQNKNKTKKKKTNKKQRKRS